MKNIKVNYVIFCFCLFMTSIMQIDASSILDFSKKGSLDITLQENENNMGVEGIEVSIYKIANAIEKNNNLVFEFVTELETCDASLNDLKDPSLPSKLSDCITEITPDAVKTTNFDGNVKFIDMDLGLYLIVQTNKIKGYSTFDSFLAMLPVFEDENWVYDVFAKPKTDIYKEIDLKVVKVWNTTNVKLPEKVTIELYKGDKLIDTVFLNTENNWTHIWLELEKSDDYTVREIDIPDGYTPSYKYNEFVFFVTNTDTLPKTGQNYYPIVLFTMVGMIFVFFGFIQLRKENK